MAAFQIHVDADKENVIPAFDTKANVVAAKQKRPFAAVNNIPRTLRNQKEKPVFRETKNHGKTKGDTKEEIKNVVPQEPKITSEVYRGFSVYQDQSDDVNESQDDPNASNCSISDVMHRSRNHTETPMSVSEVYSPMSIDKSILIEIDNKAKLVSPKKERDRFFEVPEYHHDILEYCRELEKKRRPKSSYMRKQPDINYSMRTILVDWLVEVAEEYRLQGETLCLAVSYIDRFLSYMSVVRAKLQLVGTAAMFIAAKYEEIYPPDVAEFVFITDDTYTKGQVLRMEQIILNVLSFDLCTPTTLGFINTYSVICGIPEKVKHLANYLCELSLLEGDPYLQYSPSQISSAAVALAQYLLGKSVWSSELEETTTYSLGELKEIFLHLVQTHNISITLTQQAIQEKYKAAKYMGVSTIEPVEIDETKFQQIHQSYVLESKRNFNNSARSNDDHVAATNENVRKMISSLIFV